MSLNLVIKFSPIINDHWLSYLVCDRFGKLDTNCEHPDRIAVTAAMMTSRKINKHNKSVNV
jgi:hypothetical protein